MSALQPGTFIVSLPGAPMPWKRARKSGKRHFTDSAMEAQQNAWKMAWRLAHGWRQLEYGPIEVVGAMFLTKRPPSHFLMDGSLSAAGRRSMWPDLDVDNALKLVLDALNKTAYHDDKQIRLVSDVASVWLPTRDVESHSIIVLRELTPVDLDDVATELANRITEAAKA